MLMGFNYFVLLLLVNDKILRSPIIYSTLSLLLLASLFGCSPSSCFEDTDAYLKGGFYGTGTGKSLPPDSLSVSSIPGSNLIFYNKVLKTSNVNLILDPTDTETSFLFKINGVSDTVTIRSESYPFLVSKECGFSWHHKIITVVSSHNIIDTIILGSLNVTLTNEENLRIFY